VPLLAVALLVPLAVTIAVVAALRWVEPPVTAFMVHDLLAGADAASALEWRWVDWAEIAPSMKLAVIAAEDQRFKDHRGFDPKEIASAIDAARDGGRLRGASTISQQVAKNLFLWRESSWLRKGLEAYFTVLIEATWSKRRILEVYLNVAEFGPGVYGVEAAALRYFGKTAESLDATQAARLAAVLPSPKRLRADAPSAYLRERQAWILDQMTRLGGERHLAALE
jgi:monofunctional biosynthetic peptidoglycan transglycosylase